MMLPSVTIGITTRNRAAMVSRAVKSVMTQTYEGPVECVIVDDNSTDDTEQQLGRIRGALTHYYRNDAHRGIAYSKNRALILGTGEMRGILDSDDWYEPTFIERCVDAFMADASLGCVYTDNYRADEQEKRIATEPAGEWSAETLLECKLRGDCWLARWSLLQQTQLHDELFELEVDYDLFYQLLEMEVQRPGLVRRIPQALQTVTQHEGRTSGARSRAAYWHAAGLAKYGHGIEWAMRRALTHSEWHNAIADGYTYGQSLAYRRSLKRLLRVDDNTPERWAATWANEDQQRLDTTLLSSVLTWLPERCRVVDLGCGDGSLAKAIVAARPEVRCIGLDFVKPERVPSARLEWMRFDLRSDPLPLGLTSQDVVICSEVVEHLQDPLRVFAVARQLLRPRGHLLLTTPLGDDIKDTYHLWALLPADIAALANMAGGGRILHMEKTGAYGARAVLYVIGWPDVS